MGEGSESLWHKYKVDKKPNRELVKLYRSFPGELYITNSKIAVNDEQLWMSAEDQRDQIVDLLLVCYHSSHIKGTVMQMLKLFSWCIQNDIKKIWGF